MIMDRVYSIAPMAHTGLTVGILMQEVFANNSSDICSTVNDVLSEEHIASNGMQLFSRDVRHVGITDA